MLERIYDHVTSLGLPDMAAKAIFTAAFCVPLVLLILYLPGAIGGGTPAPATSSASAPAPRSSAPPLKKGEFGVSFADDNAPKTIQPESKKALFSQLRNGMSKKEVKAIMGEGDVLSESAVPGATSSLHIYHYKGNFCQMVLYGDDRVIELMSKQFDK